MKYFNLILSLAIVALFIGIRSYAALLRQYEQDNQNLIKAGLVARDILLDSQSERHHWQDLYFQSQTEISNLQHQIFIGPITNK